MIKIFLFLIAVNFFEWSKGETKDSTATFQEKDSVNFIMEDTTGSVRQIPKLIGIHPDTNSLKRDKFTSDCGCRRGKVTTKTGEKFTIEVRKDGKVVYKDLKIPVRTTIPLPDGGVKIIEKTIDIKEIEAVRLQSKKSKKSGVNSNYTGTASRAAQNNIIAAEFSPSGGCWDIGFSLNVTPPPLGRLEMRYRWVVIPDPKWVQDSIARTEFKIPVASIKVGVFDERKNSKTLFGKGSGLPMAQMEAEAWNVFSETVLRAMVSSMKKLVYEALGTYREAMQAAVNAAAATVFGFEGINGMEVETDYPRNVWPDLPFYNTQTMDPLWGSSGKSSFPDVFGMAIPKVFQDYHAHAPFAIVLMLLADRELGKKGVSLSQIDCSRLSGSQIGGKIGNLWEDSKEDIDPSSWVTGESGGGGDVGLFEFCTNKLTQPLEQLLNYYCVGCWGYLFPRDGKVMLSSDYQAFALTAYRALSRMFDLNFPDNIENLPWPHITGWKNLQKMRADRHIFFQITSPRETGCFEVGTSQIVWENRMEMPNFDLSDPEKMKENIPDEMTFIVWRRVVLYYDAVWDIRLGI